jgi:metal transporter CNNM
VEPPETTGEPVDSTTFWWRIAISTVLVFAGGVFAGLTLGLMGLDELHLRVLATSSEDLTEKRNAQKVLKLMQKGRHWVLVVLLLGNVVINESLPIFLDGAIGGGIAAVVISTTAIVIFGEVIPQAVSVRYGLAIGARCAPFVLCLMYLFSPIAYPTAKVLDYVLGQNEGHTYKKAELKSFLQFHRTGEEPLRDDEISILNGVLELNTKNVETIMTPIKDVVTLSSDTILDHTTVDAILTSGYSRFPIHEPGNPLAFQGLLLIKKLLVYDPARALPVSDFKLSILPEAYPSINCFQALDYFQTGRAHLLLVSRTPGIAGGGIGVITLEDVIEEIISEEIVDETDRYEDNQSKRRAKRITTATVMRGIVERERSLTRVPSFERTPLLRETPLMSSTPRSDPTRYGAILAQSPKT